MEKESSESRFVAQRCSNLKSNVIEITEDKLRLILTKYIMRLRKNRDWIGYGGMTLTILLALLTCEFSKNFLGLESNIWYAIFVLGDILLGMATLISFIRAILNRKCVDKMIQEIRNDPEI